MDESGYRQLKEMNIKFQLSLPSLIGAYGWAVKKKAEWLLKRNMADLWGTDTHRLQAFIKAITDKSLKKNIAISLK